jgi:hypothetical protein
MEAQKACAASVGAKEIFVHAVCISAGGRPIFLVDDNEKTCAFSPTAYTIRQVIIRVVMDPWEPHGSASSARNASMPRTVAKDRGSQWLAMY